MKLLVVGSESARQDGQGAHALADALRERGHAVTLIASSEGASVGRGLRAAARAVQSALRQPPEAALIFVEGGAPLAVSPLLARLRVPVLLVLPPWTLANSSEPLSQGARRRWQAAVRSARAILSLDPEGPRRLHAAIGMGDVGVLGGGRLDLTSLPHGPRSPLREQMGLPSAHRIVALTGPLRATVRVDLLALAHRRLAGTGLIVIGTGPGDSAVAALSASTRPSSPVLHIPTLDGEARRVALQACDLALSLDEAPESDDRLWAAALGRRLVSFDGPDLADIDAAYPGRKPTFVIGDRRASDVQHTLERGLEIEMREGVLPAQAIEAARITLGEGRPLDQLEEALSYCSATR